MINQINNPGDICFCGDLRQHHKDGKGACELGALCVPENCTQFRFFKPFDYATNELYQSPKVALSLWQPWAWAMFDQYCMKDIENRPMRTAFRGRIAIHVSQKTPRDDYNRGKDKIERFISAGVIDSRCQVPYYSEIEHGCIIGVVTITDCVEKSGSKWFVGPFGYPVTDATPVKPIPAKGSQGFWNINAELASKFEFFYDPASVKKPVPVGQTPFMF